MAGGEKIGSKIEISKEICKVIGIGVETYEDRGEVLENLSRKIKLMSNKLKKRSIVEASKEPGKKKKGEDHSSLGIISNEVEEVNMESDTKDKVSREKGEANEEVEEIDIEIYNINDRDKETEVNDLHNIQEFNIDPSKRAKMVKRDGKFLYEDITRKEEEEKQKEIGDILYKSDHRGEIIIQARIVEKFLSKNRVNNMLKIAREMAKERIIVKGIKQCGLSVAELNFANIIEANKCLKIGRKGKEERQIIYSIPGRLKRIKGVISDWDRGVPLHELVEAMDNKEGLVQLERMKRRYIDEKTKESTFKLTDLIIVTYEGNILPEAVTLYAGVIKLRLRAFMEPVRQCFGCFEYGHYRQTCRHTNRKCMVCGKDFHGECNAEPSCINCGGKHIATDKKKCAVYEYNLNLKKTMANRNISIYDAKKIIKSPYLRKDSERRKELTTTKEENDKIRELYEKRRSNSHYEDHNDWREQRSYAEVVSRQVNSREEGSGEGKKIKRMILEKEKDNLGNREIANVDLEVRSPNYTNFRSVSDTTSFLSEEIRNMYKVMEARFRIIDEKFEKFQEMQLRIQREFLEKLLQSGIIHKDKEIREIR